ncbi:MAG: insulinase family protein [Phycisphaerae bacterium]|nr:insulinase family protein [Phycisphaerae bacterium]
MSRLPQFRHALILLLAVSSAVGAERRYDFQRKVLPNGLTVISLEDHSCPIVAVQVWYHVGSKNEDANRQGFAHMFEHMMFRGTDRLGPEDHFEYIRGTGGYTNAYTSFDNTTYVNRVPSNQLELVFWLEAERMAFLRIDEEGFYKERKVVEEERRMRSLNTPYGTVPEKVLPVIFTKHPYQWTPIGCIPHLRAATIEELQAFWDRYYTPSNATLVVVGDVTHEKVQALAERYFGWIPNIAKPVGVEIKEPPQAEPRSIKITEKKGPVPVVGLAYRAVPIDHPDALPLEMLMSILGEGESSRIYKDLVKERKLAQGAMAMTYSLEDDGLVGAGAALMPWGDKEKVIAAIREHFERAAAEGVTAKELAKARNQFLRREVTQNLTVENKARLLGSDQVIKGDAEKANHALEDIRAVTKEDLRRVAKTYLTKERETTVIVQPELTAALRALFGGKGKKDDADEGAAPSTAPTTNRVAKRGGPRAALERPQSFPQAPPVAPLIEEIPNPPRDAETLANGLKVVVVPNHEVPFVTLKLGILNGAWTEAKPGTASMAAQMITQGTKSRTAAELAEELAFNAISLSADASMDTAGVNASCVADKFKLAMKLMAEVVLTPTFPDDEFEVLRKQTVMGLMVRAKTPEYVADRELRHRLFGKHPYARTDTGELEDVRSLATEDLKTWWSRFVRPDACVLYIAGDVTSSQALALAKTYFGGWKADGPKPSPELPEIPAPAPTHIYLVDRPGSVQSQIRIGHVGITRKDPRYFAGQVLSLIFGGGFNSRLNKAIRVERGLTYGARGGLDASRFAGTFQAGTFTKPATCAEAIQVILGEIDRIRTSPPEEAELKTARSYIVGGFAGQRETPQATVGDLWLIEYAGLPQDYLTKLLGGVKGTSAKDVTSTARDLLHRDRLTIVVVGEADKLEGDLAKIAPVTVVKAPTAETKPVSGKE